MTAVSRRQALLGFLGAVVAATPVGQLAAVSPLKLWTYIRTCHGCGRDIDAPGYCSASCPIRQANIQALVRALEAGNYNAAPEPLRQGCILQVEDLNPVMAAVTFEDRPFYRSVRRKTL